MLRRFHFVVYLRYVRRNRNTNENEENMVGGNHQDKLVCLRAKAGRRQDREQKAEEAKTNNGFQYAKKKKKKRKEKKKTMARVVSFAFGRGALSM